MKRGEVMSYLRQVMGMMTLSILTYIRDLEKVFDEPHELLIHRLQDLIDESLNLRIGELEWRFRCLVWC